jgi:hypothetical protein
MAATFSSILLQGQWVRRKYSSKTTQNDLQEENVVFEVVGDVAVSDL